MVWLKESFAAGVPSAAASRAGVCAFTPPTPAASRIPRTTATPARRTGKPCAGVARTHSPHFRAIASPMETKSLLPGTAQSDRYLADRQTDPAGRGRSVFAHDVLQVGGPGFGTPARREAPAGARTESAVYSDGRKRIVKFGGTA